jgi:hypothetical protein
MVVASGWAAAVLFARNKMAASAPSEIAELVRASEAVNERTWAAIPSGQPDEETLNDFADKLLDLRADMLALYKMAVLDARRAESADEVAAIWNAVLSFARSLLTGWTVVGTVDPATEKLIDHTRQFLVRFEKTAAEHYQAHSRE